MSTSQTKFNIAEKFLINPAIINGILENANNYIFWIRNLVENKEQIETKQSTLEMGKSLIAAAQNIYFLGFGFDKNNLENIGFNVEALTGKRQDNRNIKGTINGKRIFVSKTSGKINDILMQIINKSGHYGSTGITESKLSPRMGDNNVFISERYNEISSILTTFNSINDAFNYDFDI